MKRLLLAALLTAAAQASHLTPGLYTGTLQFGFAFYDDYRTTEGRSAGATTGVGTALVNLGTVPFRLSDILFNGSITNNTFPVSQVKFRNEHLSTGFLMPGYGTWAFMDSRFQAVFPAPIMPEAKPYGMSIHYTNASLVGVASGSLDVNYHLELAGAFIDAQATHLHGEQLLIVAGFVVSNAVENYSIEITEEDLHPLPEPSTCALLGVGLGLLALRCRFRPR